MFELANVFPLSVYTNYSPSSFSLPLALQAVVCFPALMFLYEQNGREKGPETWSVLGFSACVPCSAAVCCGCRRRNLLESRCSNYRTALLLNDRKRRARCFSTETWMKPSSSTSRLEIGFPFSVSSCWIRRVGGGKHSRRSIFVPPAVRGAARESGRGSGPFGWNHSLSLGENVWRRRHKQH